MLNTNAMTNVNLKDFRREICLMTTFRHKNLLHCFGGNVPKIGDKGTRAFRAAVMLFLTVATTLSPSYVADANYVCLVVRQVARP